MGKAIRPDRVAMYIRWSTEDQGDGTTLAIQRDGCSHYILSQGWSVSERLTFIDEGFSGATLDRPALNRLRRLIDAGEIDCVVVFKLDRLSRNVVDTVKLVLEEWEDRAYLKSARESVDTATAMGKQFFYMLINYAEWERNVIRERTHAGKLRRAQEGRNPGFKPPYGYRTGAAPGSFAVCQEEAETVRLIYALAARGMGCKQIVEHLHERALRFREGLWGRTTVRAILRNPLYAGRLVFRSRSAGAPVSVESPYIPAVISPDEWESVQRQTQGRPAVPNAAQASPHLLTGLARCRCGASLYPQRTYRQGGQTYYICAGRRERGGAACGAGYARQADLDHLVEGALLKRYGDGVRLQEAVITGSADAIATCRDGLRRVSQELMSYADQERTVTKDYRTGRLSPERFEQLLAAIAADRKRAESERADLERELGQLERLSPPVSVGDPWAALALWQRKALLRRLIASLTVYQERGGPLHVAISWRDGAGGRAANAEAVSHNA